MLNEDEENSGVEIEEMDRTYKARIKKTLMENLCFFTSLNLL